MPFSRELSIISVRDREGKTAFYPLMENHHLEGILRLSLAPAPNLSSELQAEAEGYASRMLESLQYVGVLAIELFEAEGRLLANEMAPRVHNSGHWTIEGAETSQFENHLRAIAGLPLGSTAPVGYSAMVNIIGEAPETRKCWLCRGRIFTCTAKHRGRAANWAILPCAETRLMTLRANMKALGVSRTTNVLLDK